MRAAPDDRMALISASEGLALPPSTACGVVVGGTVRTGNEWGAMHLAARHSVGTHQQDGTRQAGGQDADWHGAAAMRTLQHAPPNAASR
eukprot:360663-Chlamydomonas_euryale.AAC.6